MSTFRLAAPAAAVLAALTTFFLQATADDPPKAVKPVNLDCNTNADEDEPHLSSNGRTLYYSGNAKTKWDILVAAKLPNGKWSSGKPVEGYIQSPPDVKKPADDRSVFVTPDGVYPQFIYFATNKDEKDQKGDNFDLYVSYRDGANKDFSPPEAMTVLDTADDELAPWLTKDGRTLYFSRKTKDGWRVFAATRTTPKGAQGFQEPVMVDELPANYYHATLTPDGNTMYLQGPLDNGRWGLFVSAKSGKAWGKPEPLEALNDSSGPTGDRSPSLSRDGQTLYFASDRDGGKGGLDLYSVPVADLKQK